MKTAEEWRLEGDLVAGYLGVDGHRGDNAEETEEAIQAIQADVRRSVLAEVSQHMKSKILPTESMDETSWNAGWNTCAFKAAGEFRELVDAESDVTS